jgi:hypothetical protein
MYLGAFIFSLFGFVFFNKARRLSGAGKDEEEKIQLVAEEDGEEGDEEPVLVDLEAEVEEAEEVEIEMAEEMAAEDKAPIDIEDSEPPIVPSPEKKSTRPEEEPEAVAVGTPVPSEAPKKKKPGKVSIIEFGADDFEQGEEEELQIEGVDEVTVECPGCGETFKTPLGGTIRCPRCGLEGDV